MSKPSGGVKYAHTEAAQGSDLSGRVIYADYFDLYLEFRVSKASGGVRYAAGIKPIPRPAEGQTRREGSDESITENLSRLSDIFSAYLLKPIDRIKSIDG